MCYFRNLHEGHKLIEIYGNEELLNKEKITIESSFNEINQKANNLKNKIENEIEEINKLYEKVNKEVTKYFELKHEKLTKDENDLKDKLQNEVTKVKEKLENFLSESHRVIKMNEKINKGIKLLEKEEPNLIKNLSYVSKMNKNQKETKLLFKELMRNLKINFKENEQTIKYEEYYFSGIQIPNNIQVKDIYSDNFKLSWEIDNINIINIDNNKIKFKVVIRKENENFKTAYEGNNKNCLIEGLTKETNYEIKICCIYDNLIGTFSKTLKVKTSDYEKTGSIILIESKRENEFLKKIYEWSGYKKMELIYRGTRDGSTSNVFHEKCDDKGPTICLYQNEKGPIFGGYASISWKNSGKNIKTNNCFIFTLTNIYNIEPTKFPNKENNDSIYHNSDYGPCFGYYNDIYIGKDFKNDFSYTSFPNNYIDVLGKGKSIITGDFDNNNNKYKLKEIEVFKLYK